LPQLVTLGAVGASNGALENQHQLTVLLAYLAHNGITDRATVATLFWPETNAPLNNLSSALTRIRQAIPGALIADKHQVATTLRTDALEFLDAIRRNDLNAHERYLGSFLHRFQLKSLGIELEEWIYETRDMLADIAAANAVISLARVDLDEAPQQAADLAERVLGIAPSPAIALDNIDVLYRPLALLNRPGASRLKAMADDAGIDLSPQSLPVLVPVTPDRGLIGRERELAELRRHVADRQPVNLFGIGGAGKTKLADRYAREFSGAGGHFLLVEAEAESDGDRILQAIAVKLGATSQADDPTFFIEQQLDQATLVVVDNVAPSPSVVDAVTKLSAIDKLRLILVSRTRLDVPRLENVAVRGLALRDESGATGPAVELLRQRTALTARSDADPERFDRLATRSCELVAGLPLAIELIAAWLRLLSIDEVESLLDDEELLDETPPGEELSLTGVIEQSWLMLPDRSKEALTALSVMHGSFDRESARGAVGIGIKELTDLHDHSLIDASGSGRLRCHPLVQAFARRQLAGDTERHDNLRQRHSAWFLERLRRKGDQIAGPSAGEHLQVLQSDQANIEAAWSTAVAMFETDLLIAALPAFDDFLLRSGQLFVAKQMYDLTLGRLLSGNVPQDLALAAAVANNLAWTEMLLGLPDDAARNCALGLSWLPEGHPQTHVALLRTQCALLGNAGDGERALAGYLKAREVAADLQDERLQGLLDEDVGRSHAMLGDHPAAIAAFRGTLDAARAIGDPHMEARSYLLIAASEKFSDPAHSLVLFDEGEQIATSQELRHLLAYFPYDRGLALRQLERFDEAATEFERGVMLGTEVGDRGLEIACRLGSARAHLRSGDFATGLVLLSQGLRAAILSDSWPHALGAALDVARLALANGAGSESASKLAAFAEAHPNLLEADRSIFGIEHTVRLQPGATVRLDELCEQTIRAAKSLS